MVVERLTLSPDELGDVHVAVLVRASEARSFVHGWTARRRIGWDHARTASERFQERGQRPAARRGWWTEHVKVHEVDQEKKIHEAKKYYDPPELILISWHVAKGGRLKKVVVSNTHLQPRIHRAILMIAFITIGIHCHLLGFGTTGL